VFRCNRSLAQPPQVAHGNLHFWMMLAGGVVGAGIGFLRSPEAAGTLTALCLPLAGIAASIERLSYYRKPKFPNTWKS
jgi:hypothetical protein